MVKVAHLKESIEFCEPQVAFSLLYENDDFVKKYHKISKHSYVEITSWSQDGTREVTFMAPFEAPQIIKKIVGVDSVQMKEIQKYTKEGNKYTISSESVFNIPGGDRFAAYGDIVLHPDEKGGSIFDVAITLEFKGGPWSPKGIVESFMESKARKTFQDWFALAREFSREKLNDENLQEADSDEFFDVDNDEFQNTVTNPQTSSIEKRDAMPCERISSQLLTLVDSPTLETSMGLQSWFVRALLGDMNQLLVYTSASASLLEKLHAKIMKIEKDIEHASKDKSSLETLFLAKLAKLQEDVDVLSKSKSIVLSTGTALGLYGVGIATGVALSFLYLKGKKVN